MTFVVGHEKLLDKPIRDVSKLVGFLYTQGEYDRLYRLRQHLVQEQTEAVTALPLEPDQIEQLLARVRGIQWRMDIELNRIADDKERIAELATRFWEGCGLLTDHKDLNKDDSGQTKE